MTAPACRKPFVGWIVFAGTCAGAALLGLAVASVVQRRAETVLLQKVMTPVGAEEPDSTAWGSNFPREYERHMLTLKSDRPTKYSGSVPFSHLERDPLLKTLFAGYPFSVEYNDDRGHARALEDVRKTARIDPKRGGKLVPGTCMTCKSSDVPRLMQQMGTAEFYQSTFAEIDAKVSHSIGCTDCHDSSTMKLRISRPALREALAAQGRDPDAIPHQEMRSLVCAQCHSEYYFKDGTYLTFPWKHGTTIEAMEKFYEEIDFADWTHPTSGARMVKMQHPDYEMYLTGVHAYRGVACADCHMPYRSEGGVKFTDHHVASPLAKAASSCAVCHRWSEAEITARVESIQDKTHEQLQRAEAALVAAHEEIGAAAAAGAAGPAIDTARDLVRRAQMRWDYVAANNGMGFHSPQEAGRILSSAIDLAHQARLAVVKNDER